MAQYEHLAIYKKAMDLTIRGQYRYFAEKFKGAVLFFQAGCFYEFYDDLKDEVKEILRLKRIRQSRRGITYGFPIKYGKTIAEKLVKRGMPVVFIHETDRYLTRIKERLPFVKMT
jgi:RNA-directed DNA polymerase